MRSRLFFYLRYVIFWLCVFIFFRITFLLYHHAKFQGVGLFSVVASIFHGLKHDVSLTGYILLFPTIVLILLSPFKNRIVVPVLKIYTAIIVLVVGMLLIVDHELYNYWGFRLDDTFIDYINTPREMLASLEFIHFIILIVAIAAIYFGLYRFVFKKWVIRNFSTSKNSSWISSIVFTVICAFLILPIRGGTGTSTLNTGSVYFHQNIIVNHAAINPVWNFIYTLTEKGKLEAEVRFFDDSVNEKILSELNYQVEDTTLNVLNATRPNIIIIILESFGGNTLKEISGQEGVTPNLSRFISEGIFFYNFFASGTLSDRGIAAILSGYPALPKTCILHYENKSQNIPSISKSLKSRGYKSRFYYGGDIDFAHIKSYLMNSQFDEIICHKSFSKEDYYSKWGVPDHKVFKRLLKETNSTKQPFLQVYFTLSSHEPFDVPMETVIEGNDRESQFFNSVYYTDSCMGDFIDSAKLQPWWDSTLIILVADHGTRIGNNTHYDMKRFHIPMLWLGGALSKKDTMISKYCCQTDISKTLLSQMNIDTKEYLFGKDIFNASCPSYAYYTIQNGFSFINDSIYMVYDLANNEYIDQSGQPTEDDYNIGKAYLQKVLQDFSNR